MGNDRFIELVSKKLTNDISPQESEEFQQYLNADDAYRRDFESLHVYWNNNDAEFADNALAFKKIKKRSGAMKLQLPLPPFQKTCFITAGAPRQLVC